MGHDDWLIASLEISQDARGVDPEAAQSIPSANLLSLSVENNAATLRQNRSRHT